MEQEESHKLLAQIVANYLEAVDLTTIMVTVAEQQAELVGRTPPGRERFAAWQMFLIESARARGAVGVMKQLRMDTGEMDGLLKRLNHFPMFAMRGPDRDPAAPVDLVAAAEMREEAGP